MKKTFLLLVVAAFIFACSPEIKTIYLDEMDLSAMETGWGDIQINKTVDGNPLTIAGQKYDRGIGTHAIYKALFTFNGNGDSFKALVGIDDEAAKSASVEFMVLADQKILWQSQIMHAGDPAIEVNVNLKGYDKVALLVTDGGDNINYDHVDWIDARFEYSGTEPVLSTPTLSATYIQTPPEKKEPRVNGAKVLGANPGHDFYYRIPVTGQKPINIAVESLPASLSFNPESHVISGKAPKKGSYDFVIKASNEFGETVQSISLKTDSGLSLTPPLGWNSWNCWGLTVDQDKVKAAADAMVTSGLADHGWMYINIDDGWEAEERTASGELLANDKFPNMKSLADYCHDYGLKLGIYSSPGPRTCGGYLGSYQHELQDIQTWNNWGIDYVKYDWCSYSQIAVDQSLPELMKPYSLFREQLNKVNRDIIFSLCQYGMGEVYKWGEEIGGNLWRTTGDITDTWNSMAGIGFAQDVSSPYAGPGHWNDPDMLVVGQVGWGPSLHPSKLSADEQYTHISLWALLASPLLIGCDMSQLDEFTLNLLTNDEVLEINQDPKGEQAIPVQKEDGTEVWMKKLADGSVAIGMFYTGEASPIDSFVWTDEPRSKTCRVSLDKLGISQNVKARDLWRQKDLGIVEGTLSAEIPYHGVTLIKLFNE